MYLRVLVLPPTVRVCNYTHVPISHHALITYLPAYLSHEVICVYSFCFVSQENKFSPTKYAT